MDKSVILHIDFDSFFASVEEQYNPSLRNRPFGVTAANSRTCIIASSKAAKKLGIITGSRLFEAQKTYPRFISVPADFVKYWEISKKFINICKDFSPYVEVFSIDELFMDITLTQHLSEGIDSLLQQIKQRIRKEIGEYITVSIGISHNKLLAKLASGLKKPNGVMEIKKEDVENVYKSAKLTDICGIGNRIKERLESMGIYSLLQLRSVSLSFLVSEFGNVEAQFLKNVSWGIDYSSVIPYTTVSTVKSIGRNYCLPKNEYDKRIVLQNVYELYEEIGIKLRRLNKKARTIGFYLRGNCTVKGRETVTHYVDTGKEMFNIFLYLLKREYSYEYIRQISVWVSNLKDSQELTLPLFDKDSKKDRLQQTVDRLNQRFGDHTIRNCFLLNADKLTTIPNGYMADRYERTMLYQKAEDL